MATSKNPTNHTHPNATRPLRFITCGSVDDGKSTLIGRLLWDTQSVMKDHAAEVTENPVKTAEGETRPDVANLLDGLQAEREQGITIDVAYRYFSSAKRAFIVADTPGHEQYTRNMATGASTADVAILLIDAQIGITDQTRRHATIVSQLGVRNVILAINKMDLVFYNQNRFEALKALFDDLTSWLSFDTVTAIPIAAIHGDNVVHRNTKACPWYDGLTVLETLEDIEIAHAPETPFRLCVQRVARPSEAFRGYQGTVVGGPVKKGLEIIHYPSALKSRIEAIHTFDSEVKSAVPGDAVTISLDRKLDISKGDLFATIDRPLISAYEVPAVLIVLDELGLASNTSYLLKSQSHTQTVNVVANERIDLKTGEWTDHHSLNLNEILKAKLFFETPFYCDPYAENRHTGSFILIDSETCNTVAAGMIGIGVGEDIALGTAHATWTQIAMPTSLADELLKSSFLKDHLTDIEVSIRSRPNPSQRPSWSAAARSPAG